MYSLKYEVRRNIKSEPFSTGDVFQAVAARGIFHWGGKALKNWVRSEIAVAATPKSGIR